MVTLKRSVVIYMIIIIIVIMIGASRQLSRIESFIDDYRLVKMDAFRCFPAKLNENEKGCYYSKLDGCLVFKDPDNSEDCPASPEDAGLKTDVVPEASNTSIFDYIYNAMRETNSGGPGKCPSHSMSDRPCNFDFFQKLRVMTDSELNAYMKRITAEPCSQGAICFRPENVASYITTEQDKANNISVSRDNNICFNASQEYQNTRNGPSRDIIKRIYPKCKL